VLNSVLTKTIFDNRRGIIGWGIGMLAIALFVVSIYPIIRDTPEIRDLLESYPETLLQLFGIDDIDTYTSPSGFLSVQLYSTYVPILFVIFGVGKGVAAIAGEERDQTLDLLMSNPISRSRVIWEKAGALAALVAVLAVVLFIGVWLGGLLFDDWPGVYELASASFSAILLGLVFGFLALGIGAATGRRGMSIGAAAGVAVATYIFQGIASLDESLSFFEKFSPFFYFQDHKPLVNGIHWGHTAVLVALAASFLGVAHWGFRRRDLGVS